MPTPAPSYAEQLLGLVQARLAAIQPGEDWWYRPGEVARDWKTFDEVQAFPFYGVIEGGLVPAGAQTQQGGALLEQTVTVVIWVNEDKVAWGTETKNRRTALLRACQDVARALSPLWTDTPEWLVGVGAPAIVTDEAALFAKPHAYAEVSVKFRYWAPRGGI